MHPHLTTCSIPGCTNPHRARGLCHNHYEVARHDRLRTKRTPPPDRIGEEWRSAVGYEGWYEVSNLGRVKRIGRCRGAYIGRLLKQTHFSPYWTVKLYRANIGKWQRVHRLVATAFLGIGQGAVCEVNHIDGNGTNNHVSNLEWVTKTQNRQHALHVLGHYPSGHGNSRLTWAQVTEIRSLGDQMTQGEIGRRFGLDRSGVSRILAHRTWTKP